MILLDKSDNNFLFILRSIVKIEFNKIILEKSFGRILVPCYQPQLVSLRCTTPEQFGNFLHITSGRTLLIFKLRRSTFAKTSKSRFRLKIEIKFKVKTQSEISTTVTVLEPSY